MKHTNSFMRFANWTAHATGHPLAFLLILAIVKRIEPVADVRDGE